MSTGILAVDVENVGIGSSGFLQAVKEISKELKITYINIRSINMSPSFAYLLFVWIDGLEVWIFYSLYDTFKIFCSSL